MYVCVCVCVCVSVDLMFSGTQVEHFSTRNDPITHDYRLVVMQMKTVVAMVVHGDGVGSDDDGGGVVVLVRSHDLSWCEATCHDLFRSQGEDYVFTS